mgnify:CR=1 FL=1
MSHKIIKGKRISAPIRLELKQRIAVLKERGWQPHLASIEIGSTPAASLYIRNQRRVCEKMGITFDNRKYPHDITQPEMLAAIHALNVDPRVTGMILQRPVPDHINVRSLQSAIHPLKDVEGMNPASIGNIIYNEAALAPCTAAAHVKLVRQSVLNM